MTKLNSCPSCELSWIGSLSGLGSTVTMKASARDGETNKMWFSYMNTNEVSPMILGTLGNVNTGSHPEYGHIKNVSQYWANLQEYCVSYTKENIVGKLQRHLENNEDDNW